MPKIITQLTCKKRCEQTPEMYAAIQLKSEKTLSGKQSMKLSKNAVALNKNGENK